MQKFLLFSLSLAMLLSVSGLAVAAGPDAVSLPNPLCPGGPGSPGCVDSFATLISKITDYIFTIIGILAVLMFVISGIMFVVSAGNPEKIKRAKDIAIYAAVGAIIAFAGKGLVELVKAVIGA